MAEELISEDVPDLTDPEVVKQLNLSREEDMKNSLWRYFHFQTVENLADFLREAVASYMVANCNIFHADNLLIVELAAPGIGKIEELALKYNGKQEIKYKKENVLCQKNVR